MPAYPAVCDHAYFVIIIGFQWASCGTMGLYLRLWPFPSSLCLCGAFCNAY